MASLQYTLFHVHKVLLINILKCDYRALSLGGSSTCRPTCWGRLPMVIPLVFQKGRVGAGTVGNLQAYRCKFDPYKLVPDFSNISNLHWHILEWPKLFNDQCHIWFHHICFDYIQNGNHQETLSDMHVTSCIQSLYLNKILLPFHWPILNPWLSNVSVCVNAWQSEHNL